MHLIIFILFLSITPCFGETYRVVEDGVVQEYVVQITPKDREQIEQDISDIEKDIARLEQESAILLESVSAKQKETAALREILLELPEAIIEPVVVEPPQEN